MRLLTTRRTVLLLILLGCYLVYGYALGQDSAGLSEPPTQTSAASQGDHTGHETAHAPDHGTEPSEGEGGEEEHSGPVLPILIDLVIILLAAKLGGDIFERFHQPAVLGELVLGMLVGNIGLFTGYEAFDGLKYKLTLEVLAELGVIILLFAVGLESSVREMMKVGVTSFLVALFGVIAPFFLGWGVGHWFLPDHSVYVHVFIGATLTATSVGITARVLKDIGKVSSREGKIILGAAVIDDVMGLIILAVVAGIISAVGRGSGDGISAAAVIWIIAKATLFILGAIVIGSYVLPSFFKAAVHMKVKGVFLSLCLLICFVMAYVAGKVGLAPIVGAFAAGLILEDVHFQTFTSQGEHSIHDLIEPIAVFLVPIFFVRMGMLVDLSTFARVEILGFAAVLTIAAIIGKQVCALAVFDKATNRVAVGLGMIPRGEVGLIFAGIGAKLMLDGEPVVCSETYSAVVIMVIVTTLVTPPLLRLSLMRGDKTSTPRA